MPIWARWAAHQPSQQHVGGEGAGDEEQQREQHGQLPEAVDVLLQGGVGGLIGADHDVARVVGGGDLADLAVEAGAVGAGPVGDHRLRAGRARAPAAATSGVRDEQDAEVVLGGEQVLAAAGRPQVLG